jgi:hypothetical protein
MLYNLSPTGDCSTLSIHGSMSPEVTRPTMSGRPRASQLQYPSPPENVASPFSTATAQSSTTLRSGSSSTTTDFGTYQQASSYIKRSNSDHSLPANQAASHPPLPDSNRSQRHSFGVADAKGVDPMFARPQLQSPVGQYGIITSTTGNQSYQGNLTGQSSMHSYVSQQHFTPFSLPPPGFSSIATTTSPQAAEHTYAVSSPHGALQSDYPQRDSGTGQHPGPDMMLLDQMTAPNTMPVFGGEGYSRSPFAIPDDFVAYLGLFNNPSPIGQSGMGQQMYDR